MESGDGDTEDFLEFGDFESVPKRETASVPPPPPSLPLAPGTSFNEAVKPIE